MERSDSALSAIFCGNDPDRFVSSNGIDDLVCQGDDHIILTDELLRFAVLLSISLRLRGSFQFSRFR